MTAAAKPAVPTLRRTWLRANGPNAACNCRASNSSHHRSNFCHSFLHWALHRGTAVSTFMTGMATQEPGRDSPAIVSALNRAAVQRQCRFIHLLWHGWAASLAPTGQYSQTAHKLAHKLAQILPHSSHTHAKSVLNKTLSQIDTNQQTGHHNSTTKLNHTNMHNTQACTCRRMRDAFIKSLQQNR